MMDGMVNRSSRRELPMANGHNLCHDMVRYNYNILLVLTYMLNQVGLLIGLIKYNISVWTISKVIYIKIIDKH